MTHIPNDLKKSLEESGVKFDENGNVIEDDFFENVVDGNEDQDDFEDQDEDEDDSDQDEDDSDEDQDDSDDEDEDEDEDEEVEKPKRKKLKETSSWKNNLTPKSEKTNSGGDSTSEVLKRIDALQQQIQGNQQPSDEDDLSEDPNQKLLVKLQEEARNFEQMAMKRLASELSREVNRRFEKYQVNYNQVIRSQEWDDFLDTKIYGESIGKRYQSAIKNQDLETMLDVFDDFGEKNLKLEEVKKKKNIAKLAVPESSKARKTAKKRSKYLFNASDYSKNLNSMERGKMSPEEFYQFEAKYEQAEKEGRVNSTN